MYHCNDCGSEWLHPRVIRDGGGDVGEDWRVCPDCGSDDFERMTKCPICGEYICDETRSLFADAHDTCTQDVVARGLAALRACLSPAELGVFSDYYGFELNETKGEAEDGERKSGGSAGVQLQKRYQLAG